MREFLELVAGVSIVLLTLFFLPCIIVLGWALRACYKAIARWVINRLIGG